MDDDLRLMQKHELSFGIEHALSKARALSPRKRAHGDRSAPVLVASAVVEHLDLCGMKCFRRPPRLGHGTPLPKTPAG